MRVRLFQELEFLGIVVAMGTSLRIYRLRCFNSFRLMNVLLLPQLTRSWGRVSTCLDLALVVSCFTSLFLLLKQLYQCWMGLQLCLKQVLLKVPVAVPGDIDFHLFNV